MKKIYQSWYYNLPPEISSLGFEERIVMCLRYGTLAPSTHNSQPWSLKLKGSSCEVRLNQRRLLPIADPQGREAFISLGCFIENCIISAKFLNLVVQVEPHIDDAINSVVKLIFQDINTPRFNEIEKKLFNAIPQRVNARGFYEKDFKLPPHVRDEFQQICKVDDDVETLVFESRTEISHIARLTGEAVREAQSSRHFRKEFGNLLKNNITNSGIGMPAFSIGLPLLASFIAPLIFRNVDVSRILERVNSSAIMASSAVILICTKDNSADDWFKVGRVFERGNLFLISNNLKTSIHIAAAELEKYAQSLMKDFSLKKRPQMVFRIGHSTRQFRHTPRLPVEEFITD